MCINVVLFGTACGQSGISNCASTCLTAEIITTSTTETTTVTTLPVDMVNIILTGNGTEITETGNANGNGTEITMATGRGNASVTGDVTAPPIDAGHTCPPSAMKSSNRFALFGMVASLIAVMLLAIAVLARRRLRRTRWVVRSTFVRCRLSFKVIRMLS